MHDSLKSAALDQERTSFFFIKCIVSAFEYAQSICGRPVKLKPISRGISSEWFAVFVSCDFLVYNWPVIYMSIRFTMSENANIGEKAVYCLLHFCLSRRWYSFK